MNEALISGLLGAVMGGTSSIEKSIAEEMAAKQREEEEKRREERALTIAERKLEMEAAKKKRLEEARRGEIAGYLPAATGATPSQSPMEPEGGGITEYQVPTEQRLVRGFEAAMAKGDTDAAKVFSDQYKALKQEERAQAEEARKQEEFARGPKPKEPTGEVATIQFLARQTYTGPVGEDGKPDPVAFAKHMKDISESFIERKTYIRPERVAGGPKPLSMAAEDVQQGKVKKLITDISTDQVGKAKVKNTAKENALGQILSDYQGEVAKANPDDPQAFYRIDLNTVERELRGRLKTAQDAAASEAGAKFTEYRNATKLPNESPEQFKARKEAILPNQLHRAFADNKKSTKDVFVEAVKDDFLSSAPKSQTAKPATKTVTDGGKKYTVRLAPDGKYYREENGQFFEYKGP